MSDGQAFLSLGFTAWVCLAVPLASEEAGELAVPCSLGTLGVSGVGPLNSGHGPALVAGTLADPGTHAYEHDCFRGGFLNCTIGTNANA